LSLKLAARLVVFPPYKIADLKENDTTVHTEDLSSILPPGTQAIIIRANRVSGTGYLLVYPTSGPTSTLFVDENQTPAGATIPIKNQELKWKNTVANDDWDVYLFGYFVQKRTRAT